jgi:hypothetical protein
MRVTFPPGFDGRNRRGESFAKQKDGGVFQLDGRQAARVRVGWLFFSPESIRPEPAQMAVEMHLQPRFWLKIQCRATVFTAVVLLKKVYFYFSNRFLSVELPSKMRMHESTQVRPGVLEFV